MAVGQTYRERFFTYRDPLTGREVTRITDPAAHCHHPYFYCRAFTPDSRRVVYVSHRTGRGCIYLLDLESRESVQLTDGPGLSEFLITLTPDGKHLFYSAEHALRRLTLDTFEDAEVFRETLPFTGGEGVYPGFSDDFSQALVCQMHQEDLYVGKSDWDFFEPQWRAKPRCRLVMVDLHTGRENVLLEEACWLGHPQIRPGDPQTLMYCHEGPSHLVDARIWLMRADGTGKRPLGYVEKIPGAGTGEIVTHEYFTPDGQYAAYTHFPKVYGTGGSIRLMHLDSMAETNLGPVHNYSHFYHSPDCRWIVGDEAKKVQPEENCIWIFDIAARREYPLCRHGASFACRGKSTQDAHPHPCFAPDNRKVLFTTDRETGPTGNCSVYLAEAADGKIQAGQQAVGSPKSPSNETPL